MDMIRFFLGAHASLHARDVHNLQTPTVERWLGGLSDDQLRMRPGPGLNSIAWLLWHMARTEDVAVNLVVSGQSQVLDESWARRLKVDRRDIGTGMTDEEVSALTSEIDLEALRAYRSAVGIRTRDTVRDGEPRRWSEVIGADDLRRAHREAAFRGDREVIDGVIDAGRHPWHGHTRGDQLARSALTHNAAHIGEAVTVRALGGFAVGI